MADDDLRQRLDALEAREQLGAAVGELRRRSQSAEAEFRRDHPDYDRAASHWQTSRRRQLSATGIHDPTEQQHRVAAEALQIANRAIAQGRDPAETIYRLAEINGYRPAGSAMPAATAARAKPPGSAGEVHGGSVTPERALKMSDAQFAKFIATPEGKRLLGT